jgi:hypothetical protein
VAENRKQPQLIAELSHLWKDEQDQRLVLQTIQALDSHYDLNRKIASEPGVAEIIQQMFGRLAKSYARLIHIQEKRILDIACGSNTSKAPPVIRIDTPFGAVKIGGSGRGYTAQFEPWFCRILVEMGVDAVGIDLGELDGEAFTHHRVDLGRMGALDFLPSHSFDGVQDSRLFGSPEFTAQFPKQADRLKVAQEVRRQEKRLLKTDGIMIHSDAAALVERLRIS